MRIVILGAGNIGQALAEILKPVHARIELWDKDAAKNPGQKELSKIIPKAEIIFLGIPSWAIPEALSEVKPYISRHTIIVSISKGIEAGSGKTTDELLRHLLPKGQPFALLSGPMLAGELLAHMGGSAVAASDSARARRTLDELFRKTELHLHTSKDVHGTALAGVLKNIYALLLGAAEGMGMGWNAKGFLAAEALSEMSSILPKLRGLRETASCPAGLGDLVATGMSPMSRNSQVGKALASGDGGPTVSEGTKSIPFILKRLGSSSHKFPLLMIVAKFLEHPRAAKIELKKYVTGT